MSKSKHFNFWIFDFNTWIIQPLWNWAAGVNFRSFANRNCTNIFGRWDGKIHTGTTPTFSLSLSLLSPVLLSLLCSPFSPNHYPLTTITFMTMVEIPAHHRRCCRHHRPLLQKRCTSSQPSPFHRYRTHQRKTPKIQGWIWSNRVMKLVVGL